MSRDSRAEDRVREKTVAVTLTQPGTSLRMVESYFTGATWWYGKRIVCSAPCEMSLPAAASYEVVGDGIATSRTFQLPDHDVTLRVQPGNQSAHDFGGIFVIGGAFALAIGGVICLGAASQAHSGDFGTGAATALGGAIAMGLGLPLMIGNATTVHFE
jgi:hypothetical protein